MRKIKPGIWRHYRGQLYRVIGTAKHTETGEQVVMYEPLYGEPMYWVRPAFMWEEEVEYLGEKMKRFTWVREH